MSGRSAEYFAGEKSFERIINDSSPHSDSGLKASRFLETEETIEINLGVLSSDVELTLQNTTFILKGNILFTFRQGELRVFAETVRKLKSASAEMKEHGLDVFLSILETHIDSDADIIESINRRVNYQRR